MMKIAWTIQAQRRVIEILEYSQQEFGNKATDRLARTIEQKTLQLINNPFRGPVELILAKEKKISCRYLLVNPYKIIYYVDEKEESIYIVTLFHTHLQSWTKKSNYKDGIPLHFLNKPPPSSVTRTHKPKP